MRIRKTLLALTIALTIALTTKTNANATSANIYTPKKPIVSYCSYYKGTTTILIKNQNITNFEVMYKVNGKTKTHIYNYRYGVVIKDAPKNTTIHIRALNKIDRNAYIVSRWTSVKAKTIKNAVLYDVKNNCIPYCGVPYIYGSNKYGYVEANKFSKPGLLFK